ncbi:hypothetical protein ES703_77493 [subsurface metagenome]
MRYRYWIAIGASVILGLIFATAGVGKLLEQTETFKIFLTLPRAFFTPTLVVQIVSVWLPPVELILGLLLIIGIAAKLIATFSSVLIGAFIANNSWLLSQGFGYKPCSCFGVLEIILRGKLSTAGALYLDIIMLALVFTIIFCYPSNFLAIRPWFFRKR